AAMIALGAAWGVAQMLFGLAVDAIGITLAFAIVPSISVAIGTLVPLIRLHPEMVLTTKGFGVVMAVGLVITGIVMCAISNRLRSGQNHASLPPLNPSFRRGLLIAILSGLGAAMVNFGIAFGGVLVEAARNNGAHPFWAPNVIWFPVL